MDYGYKTDAGKVRDLNEDRYLFVNEDDYVILVVADGMGGHNAGDIASTIAIDEVLKYNLNKGFLEDTEESLKECIDVTNRKIYDYSISNPDCHGMGTTLTMAVIIKDKVYIANVGDSRAYIINDEIERITVDHSYVEELKIMGRITEEEAINHPNKNQITRAVGTEKEVETDIFTKELNKKDVILLCTDGLTNMVMEDEILSIVRSAGTLQKAIDTLVLTANMNGGRDNITVVGYVNDEGGKVE